MTTDNRPFWFPMCARCGKVVDQVDTMRDDVSGKAVVNIFCHGAMESRVVGRIEEDAVRGLQQRLNRAFVTESADMAKAKEGWVV